MTQTRIGVLGLTLTVVIFITGYSHATNARCNEVLRIIDQTVKQINSEVPVPLDQRSRLERVELRDSFFIQYFRHSDATGSIRDEALEGLAYTQLMDEMCESIERFEMDDCGIVSVYVDLDETGREVSRGSGHAEQCYLTELESGVRSASEEAMLHDIALGYAKSNNVSVDEAKRRLIRESTLADDIQRLVKMEQERVAGWGINHGKRFFGWVMLKGGHPATSESQAYADGIEDVELVSGAVHTLKELEVAHDKLFNDPTASGETFAGITGSNIDFKKNAIEIMTLPGGHEELVLGFGLEVRQDYGQLPAIIDDQTEDSSGRIFTYLYRGIRLNIVESNVRMRTLLPQ